jgi:hypothetical protein
MSQPTSPARLQFLQDKYCEYQTAMTRVGHELARLDRPTFLRRFQIISQEYHADPARYPSLVPTDPAQRGAFYESVDRILSQDTPTLHA